MIFQVQRATRQVMDRIPTMTSTSPSSFSTLFLQLTVDDLGICVPVLANSLQVCYILFSTLFLQLTVDDLGICVPVLANSSQVCQIIALIL